ncbi:MAG: MFS transporter [Lentisphaeria bacterium]|nr:MFS transporter [Lentisphaeria bacterium]
MIRKQPLTAAQREASQHNYNIFSLINGLSYMCLGETVLILLAVRLGCPDYIVSTLGAMIYFGFLLLPLGKIVTARTGAARSQSIFWVARNAAALLVAGAALVSLAGFRETAMGLLLIGAFFFYGFRAAGVVMSQPLVGNITTDADRGRVIGISTGLFYVSCLVALVTISLLLKLSDSLGMLTGIIVTGALCGFTSSRFINRIDETESIRDSARKPIGGEFRKVLRDKSLLRLLAAGFSINLAVIMLIPISMLALKRGCGVSDTEALLYALVQFGASAVASFLSGKVANTIGPRKTMLYAYTLLLAAGAVWLVAPAQFNPYYMILPFLIAGSTYIGTTNSVTHYFLQTVPEERRVASSMFIAVINGAGAGIIGMLLAGTLLDFSAGFAPEGNALYGYRIYFAVSTLLLSAGVWVIGRLAPLPLEKRKIKKSWNETV